MYSVRQCAALISKHLFKKEYLVLEAALLVNNLPEEA